MIRKTVIKVADGSTALINCSAGPEHTIRFQIDILKDGKATPGLYIDLSIENAGPWLKEVLSTYTMVQNMLNDRNRTLQ